MDPRVYKALARWAADEVRSTTVQIELLLRESLLQAGRLPPPTVASYHDEDGPRTQRRSA